MESGIESENLENENIVKDEDVSVQNGNKSSESEDDDDFYNQLFTGATPTYVSAPTDYAPWLDDSDTEMGSCETVVKFYTDRITSLAVAEYNSTEYRIGFLDLTHDEYACLGIMSETIVELSVNVNNILIHHNQFNIKRINERQVEKSKNHLIESWFEMLNLIRIQFSSTEPFLVKYQDDIYFVGKQLYDEYLSLLHRTKKSTGTAIRISKDRLKCDALNHILDVNHTIAFKNQNEICMISDAADANRLHDGFPSSRYRRFVISNDPFLLVEVEPNLLHSSIYDECTEIYAGNDFPFIGTEKMVTNRKESQNKELNQQKNKEATDCGNASRSLKMCDLPDLNVPDRVKDIIDGKLDLDRYWRPSSKKPNINSYLNRCKTMIFLEQEEHMRYLNKFKRTNIKIAPHADRQFYLTITDDLSELMAAIDEYSIDRIVLKPTNQPQESTEINEIVGQIFGIKEKKIIFEVSPVAAESIRDSYKNGLFEMSFQLNRIPYQLQHYALDFLVKHELFVRLIENSHYNCKTAVAEQKIHNLYNGTLFRSLNSEQQLAVKNIFVKTDKCPHIVIGGPGTGKTRTLLALIEQIVRTTMQNVIVCSMSDNACDEIAKRLIDISRKGEVYRFYGNACNYVKTSSRIRNVSNLRDDGIYYPPLDFLYKFRVIVCTLSSAGFITRARGTKNWKADHFEYVIIDDCASAPETMSLIPISGLCTSFRKIHAKIILAGDPKQMNIIPRSNYAKQMGYNVSWMEHLCSEKNLYIFNAEGKYNEFYITHLVKNYRSHPKILSIANMLFYKNKLQSKANRNDVNWFINSEFLPSKEFPFVFKSVQGMCRPAAEQDTVDVLNKEEIDEVINTIKELLTPKSIDWCNDSPGIRASHIGVVTPYHKQSNKIARILHRLKLNEVTVGTADTFHGIEKPVMIISTVQSNGDLGRGLVVEPKWLNFVINRAKCLVVIIGDPHTLKLDQNWLQILKFCMESNSFIQSDTIFSTN